MSTQTAEFATRIGRNPQWLEQTAAAAIRGYAACRRLAHQQPETFADTEAELAEGLQDELDHIVWISERSTSGEAA